MMDIKCVVDITKFGKRDCPKCGQSIPRDSMRCPLCGYDFTPPWKCPQWVGFVILGLLVWMVIWFMLH